MPGCHTAKVQRRPHMLCQDSGKGRPNQLALIGAAFGSYISDLFPLRSGNGCFLDYQDTQPVFLLSLQTMKNTDSLIGSDLLNLFQQLRR